MGPSESPLGLLARINTLRADVVLWDLLENKEAEILDLDRAICHVAGCQWFRLKPLLGYEPPTEHSLQELVRRATLELPTVKPARIRHLLARDTKSGRLERIDRGRYIRAPWEWQWLEPEEREERHALNEQDARSYARFERSYRKHADVLLIHYLILWPAYRKSKALEISERAYYYHLGQALDVLGETVETYRRLMLRLPNVQS